MDGGWLGGQESCLGTRVRKGNYFEALHDSEVARIVRKKTISTSSGIIICVNFFRQL